jgi:hypothetical protein
VAQGFSYRKNRRYNSILGGVTQSVTRQRGFYAHGYYNPSCGTIGIPVSKTALLVRKKMAFQ